MLDDYFSSNEFLASVEMGSSFDLPSSLTSPVTPMAGQHSLITGSPFVDSGVGLDAMGGGMGTMSSNCIEVDDDVFIVDPPTLTGSGGLKSGDSSCSSNSTLVTSTPVNNGLSRSRRSHFSRKDSAPEGIKDGAGATPATKDDSTPGIRRWTSSNTIDVTSCFVFSENRSRIRTFDLLLQISPLMGSTT